MNGPKKETGVTLAQQSMPSKCRFASKIEVWEREPMDAIYSGVLIDFMEHHKKPVLADYCHALLLNGNIQQRKEVMLGRLLDHYKAIKSELCKAVSAVQPTCGIDDEIESPKTEGPKNGNNLVGIINITIAQPPNLDRIARRCTNVQTLTDAMKHGATARGERHATKTTHTTDYQTSGNTI